MNKRFVSFSSETPFLFPLKHELTGTSFLDVQERCTTFRAPVSSLHGSDRNDLSAEYWFVVGFSPPVPTVAHRIGKFLFKLDSTTQG